MEYVALKPCQFGGTVYAAGAIVPAAVIEKRAVRRLLELGKLRLALPADTAPPAPEYEHLDAASLAEWSDVQLRSLASDMGVTAEASTDRDALIALIVAVDLLPDDAAAVDIGNYAADPPPPTKLEPVPPAPTTETTTSKPKGKVAKSDGDAA